MVEKDCPHIVQMAVEREKTPASLIGPDFDFVVVSSGNKQWLCFVKVYSANRSVMLLEALDKRAHTIVP